MSLFKLAFFSLKNRLLSTSLTIGSFALSVMLLLGLERIRNGAEEGFSNALSGTDLIVGARSSEIQLLLYTIFHMGSATNNISYESYEHFKKHPSVAWAVPISLGDSFEGFRVVATHSDFIKRYKYHDEKSLKLQSGAFLEGVFDVVLGSQVARKLKLELEKSVVLSHGTSEQSLLKHSDKPFQVKGILEATGTPIDRAVFISLEGMEALHMGWENGAPSFATAPQKSITPENFEITQITSFLVGTHNKVQSLRLSREISTYAPEAIMAIMPGVALSKLWNSLSYVDIALKSVIFCTAAVSLLSLLLVLYSSLHERRREMAILRALGLRPLKLVFLLVFESAGVIVAGSLLGIIFLYSSLSLLQPTLIQEFGLYIPLQKLSALELKYLASLLLLGSAMSLLPAWSAYKKSLSDGLSPRL